MSRRISRRKLKAQLARAKRWEKVHYPVMIAKARIAGVGQPVLRNYMEQDALYRFRYRGIMYSWINSMQEEDT